MVLSRFNSGHERRIDRIPSLSVIVPAKRNSYPPNVRTCSVANSNVGSNPSTSANSSSLHPVKVAPIAKKAYKKERRKNFVSIMLVFMIKKNYIQVSKVK